MPETQFTQVQYTLQGLMTQMAQIGLPEIRQAEFSGEEVRRSWRRQQMRLVEGI